MVRRLYEPTGVGVLNDLTQVHNGDTVAKWRASAKSCVMKSSDNPRSRTRHIKIFESRRIDTSNIDTGSSATMKSGSKTSAHRDG